MRAQKTTNWKALLEPILLLSSKKLQRQRDKYTPDDLWKNICEEWRVVEYKSKDEIEQLGENDDTLRCQCGHQIHHLVRIKNTKTKNVTIVGIDCIERFRWMEPHYCKACECNVKPSYYFKHLKTEKHKKNQRELEREKNMRARDVYFEFGKYEGKTLTYVFKKDLGYLVWLRKNRTIEIYNCTYETMFKLVGELARKKLQKNNV